MRNLSRHAARRSAQRAIPEAAIDLALDYGDTQRVKGADSFFFNAPARRRLHSDLGRDGLRRVERFLRIYVVVGENGQVITAAWRRSRLRRR